MGEARRKKLKSGATGEGLRQKFEQLGIDCSQPGFYDLAAFTAQERTDPRFLENYAQWVLTRDRSPDEDRRTREILPRLSNIICARLERHQWLGACVAITGMVSRILDRMGIWNCGFQGSVLIKDHQKDESRHFAIIDEHEGPGRERGHMWLTVPPYDIVDMTLRFQRWRNDPFQESIERALLVQDTQTVRARAEDMVAATIRQLYARREGRADPALHLRLSVDQRRVSSLFPARSFCVGACEYRYVPAGVTVSDVPLEQVNSISSHGVSGREIWEEDVAPAFGLGTR